MRLKMIFAATLLLGPSTSFAVTWREATWSSPVEYRLNLRPAASLPLAAVQLSNDLSLPLVQAGRGLGVAGAQAAAASPSTVRVPTPLAAPAGAVPTAPIGAQAVSPPDAHLAAARSFASLGSHEDTLLLSLKRSLRR